MHLRLPIGPCGIFAGLSVALALGRQVAGRWLPVTGAPLGIELAHDGRGESRFDDDFGVRAAGLEESKGAGVLFAIDIVGAGAAFAGWAGRLATGGSIACEQTAMSLHLVRVESVHAIVADHGVKGVAFETAHTGNSDGQPARDLGSCEEPWERCAFVVSFVAERGFHSLERKRQTLAVKAAGRTGPPKPLPAALPNLCQ